MTDTATRYPLAWPVGWPRTPRAQRTRARFRGTTREYGDTGSWLRSSHLSVYQALTRLTRELTRLRASAEIISTNVPTRLDGMPRSNAVEPEDSGVAVYFRLTGQPRCLACDTWDRVADNIAALAGHIEAIRRIDRYGVGTLEQAFAGYTQLTTGSDPWWVVLGVTENATTDEIEEAFRLLSKRLHPDVGGSHDEMTRLTTARETARALRRAR